MTLPPAALSGPAGASGAPAGAGGYLEGLNPQQLEAVLAPPGPALVLAGAGSGKTRVIVRRILHLLSGGTPPGAILALTFTNKASGEMKERLAEALGPGVRGTWMGTFHATGARILRAEFEQARRQSSSVSSETASRPALMAKTN